MDSPELAALAEQLHEDARRLAACYPPQSTVRVERTSRRFPRERVAAVLAAGLSAVALVWWIGSADAPRRAPYRGLAEHRAVSDASPTAEIRAAIDVGPPAAGVLVVPVATFESLEDLTAPEREAVFDLIEGDTAETLHLSI